jgi:sorbose reductase
VQLAKSLAIEWVDFCRVNCISPGYITTEMLAEAPEEQKAAWLASSPAGRLGETHELKGVCYFSFLLTADVFFDALHSC